MSDKNIYAHVDIHSCILNICTHMHVHNFKDLKMTELCSYFMTLRYSDTAQQTVQAVHQDVLRSETSLWSDAQATCSNGKYSWSAAFIRIPIILVNLSGSCKDNISRVTIHFIPTKCLRTGVLFYSTSFPSPYVSV